MSRMFRILCIVLCLVTAFSIIAMTQRFTAAEKQYIAEIQSLNETVVELKMRISELEDTLASLQGAVIRFGSFG